MTGADEARAAPTKARVLLLIKGLGLGGAERLLSESIPWLDRSRFDYEVCYLTPWKDDVVPHFEAAGIPVHCLDIRRDASPRNLARLRRFLRGHRYDVIHTHSPFPSALTRVLAPRDEVIIHTEHSLPGSRNLITRMANRLTYPWCDLVISVSGVVDSAVRNGPIFRPTTTRIVHGGVDERLLGGRDPAERDRVLARLGVPEGDLVVGNVAHLRRQKGHETWLRSAAAILEGFPDTTFVIVGREKEPGFQRSLEELSETLGIAKRVHFAGFQEDPYPYMASFDVFLMASDFEGFPIALVEAMALGVPVVATDVGGVGEALGTGSSQQTAPAGDWAGLAERVTQLLGDDALRLSLAESARHRVRSEFTIESMVNAVEGAYTELLDAGA